MSVFGDRFMKNYFPLYPILLGEWKYSFFFLMDHFSSFLLHLISLICFKNTTNFHKGKLFYCISGCKGNDSIIDFAKFSVA